MTKRPPMQPGAFNLYKKLPKESGCRACKKNVMGICKLANREVPFMSYRNNSAPKWCPRG